MRSFSGVVVLIAALVTRVATVNVYERDKGGSCPPGQYSSGNGCQTCQAGYYCTDSKPDKCQKGTYSGPGASTCTACPSGTYSSQDYATSCTPAQCGWYTTGAGSGSGTRGATGQTQCGAGSYSSVGSSSCTKCPAGSYCGSATTCAPTQCQPGRYAPQAGASDCQMCPAGTYNNNYGSTSCCSCCSGTFNSATGQTFCQKCPEIPGSLVTSDVGSTSSQQCHAYGTGDPAPIPGSCDNSSVTQNRPTCPATTGPQPSGGFRKRSLPRGCALKSHTRCEVRGGQGGWECIDTSTALDACGSCDNDCSAIPYVGEVKCVKGECRVSSCRKGFALRHFDDQATCVPVSKHAYMIFEADAKLMEQS